MLPVSHTSGRRDGRYSTFFGRRRLRPYYFVGIIVIFMITYLYVPLFLRSKLLATTKIQRISSVSVQSLTYNFGEIPENSSLSVSPNDLGISPFLVPSTRLNKFSLGENTHGGGECSASVFLSSINIVSMRLLEPLLEIGMTTPVTNLSKVPFSVRLKEYEEQSSSGKRMLSRMRLLEAASSSSSISFADLRKSDSISMRIQSNPLVGSPCARSLFQIKSPGLGHSCLFQPASGELETASLFSEPFTLYYSSFTEFIDRSIPYMENVQCCCHFKDDPHFTDLINGTEENYLEVTNLLSQPVRPLFPEFTSSNDITEHYQPYTVTRRVLKSYTCYPFLIISGAQKSGSTALFSYLSFHPFLNMPSHKELHFFDRATDAVSRSYLQAFPEMIPPPYVFTRRSGRSSPLFTLVENSRGSSAANLGESNRMFPRLSDSVMSALPAFSNYLHPPKAHPAILFVILDRVNYAMATHSLKKSDLGSRMLSSLEVEDLTNRNLKSVSGLIAFLDVVSSLLSTPFSPTPPSMATEQEKLLTFFLELHQNFSLSYAESSIPSDLESSLLLRRFVEYLYSFASKDGVLPASTLEQSKNSTIQRLLSVPGSAAPDFLFSSAYFEDQMWGESSSTDPGSNLGLMKENKRYKWSASEFKWRSEEWRESQLRLISKRNSKSGNTDFFEHPDDVPRSERFHNLLEKQKLPRSHLLPRFFAASSLRSNFESTPSYTLTPHFGESLRSASPHSKSILLLREPASRSYSEYSMKMRRVRNIINLDSLRSTRKVMIPLHACIAGSLEPAAKFLRHVLSVVADFDHVHSMHHFESIIIGSAKSANLNSQKSKTKDADFLVPPNLQGLVDALSTLKFYKLSISDIPRLHKKQDDSLNSKLHSLYPIHVRELMALLLELSESIFGLNQALRVGTFHSDQSFPSIEELWTVNTTKMRTRVRMEVFNFALQQYDKLAGEFNGFIDFLLQQLKFVERELSSQARPVDVAVTAVLPGLITEFSSHLEKLLGTVLVSYGRFTLSTCLRREVSDSPSFAPYIGFQRSSRGSGVEDMTQCISRGIIKSDVMEGTIFPSLAPQVRISEPPWRGRNLQNTDFNDSLPSFTPTNREEAIKDFDFEAFSKRIDLSLVSMIEEPQFEEIKGFLKLSVQYLSPNSSVSSNASISPNQHNLRNLAGDDNPLFDQMKKLSVNIHDDKRDERTEASLLHALRTKSLKVDAVTRYNEKDPFIGFPPGRAEFTEHFSSRTFKSKTPSLGGSVFSNIPSNYNYFSPGNLGSTRRKVHDDVFSDSEDQKSLDVLFGAMDLLSLTAPLLDDQGNIITSVHELRRHNKNIKLSEGDENGLDGLLFAEEDESGSLTAVALEQALIALERIFSSSWSDSGLSIQLLESLERSGSQPVVETSSYLGSHSPSTLTPLDLQEDKQSSKSSRTGMDVDSPLSSSLGWFVRGNSLLFAGALQMFDTFLRVAGGPAFSFAVDSVQISHAVADYEHFLRDVLQKQGLIPSNLATFHQAVKDHPEERALGYSLHQVDFLLARAKVQARSFEVAVATALYALTGVRFHSGPVHPLVLSQIAQVLVDPPVPSYSTISNNGRVVRDVNGKEKILPYTMHAYTSEFSDSFFGNTHPGGENGPVDPFSMAVGARIRSMNQGLYRCLYRITEVSSSRALSAETARLSLQPSRQLFDERITFENVNFLEDQFRLEMDKLRKCSVMDKCSSISIRNHIYNPQINLSRELWGDGMPKYGGDDGMEGAATSTCAVVLDRREGCWLHGTGSNIVEDFLYRSLYLRQISGFVDSLGLRNLLIINDNDLRNETQRTLHRVTDFLGIPRAHWEDIDQDIIEKRLSTSLPSFENSGWQLNSVYDPLSPSLKKDLLDFFKPYNEALFRYLGIDFGWNNF